MQDPPPTKDGLPANEALLALARLLGRQAAREFLRGAEVGTAGSPLTGDPSDAPAQFPFPNGPQADPSSDAV